METKLHNKEPQKKKKEKEKKRPPALPFDINQFSVLREKRGSRNSVFPVE